MTQNLEYELPRVLRTSLRSNLTDYNANRVGTFQVFIGRPDVAIGKNSFPRIIVDEVSETGEVMDIARNFQYDNRCQITIEVWDVKGDEMVLTIDGVTYSGAKLLDYLIREVKNAVVQNLSDFITANYTFHTPRIIPGLSKRRDTEDDRILFSTFDVAFQHENINV